MSQLATNDSAAYRNRKSEMNDVAVQEPVNRVIQPSAPQHLLLGMPGQQPLERNEDDGSQQDRFEVFHSTVFGINECCANVREGGAIAVPVRKPGLQFSGRYNALRKAKHFLGRSAVRALIMNQAITCARMARDYWTRCGGTTTR